MKCKICSADVPSVDKSGLCPACLQKLQTAATASSSLLKAPAKQVGKAEAPSAKIPVREAWRADGAPACELKWPITVGMRANGELLVLDQPDQYRVLRFDQAGRCLGILLEVPSGSGPAEVEDPLALCSDGVGRIYIADGANDRVCVWKADGSFLKQIGGSGSRPGKLAHSSDVAVDEDGFLYVADTFNRRIQKFTPDGLVCLEIATAGDWGPFAEPVSIASDRQQNIYVVDQQRNRLLRFAASGAPHSCLPADKQELFQEPRTVRLARGGGVFVIDKGNRRLRRFATSGALVGTADLPGDADGFESCHFALLDQAVVLADRNNDRLVCFAFAETPSKKAGSS